MLERSIREEPGAITDVSLEVADGEFVVLVGPSGCGKSTLLRMVAGLEEVTEGTLRIGDNIVNDVSPKDRDIAMVFQNYALYPHMSVFDNMAFGLKMRRLPREEIRRKVDEAASILGDLRTHGSKAQVTVRWTATAGGDGEGPSSGSRPPS